MKKILEGEKNTCNLTYVSTVKAFARRMGLKYFSHSPVLNAAAHTQHIFSLEKLRHKFFQTKHNFSDFVDPNKQIKPIRSLHLATSAIIAQNVRQYLINSDIEIVDRKSVV